MRDALIPSNQTVQPFKMGFILAAGGTSLFALKSIFVKLAYAQGIDSATLLLLRMLFAAPFYLIILVWVWTKPEQIKPIKTEYQRIIALGFSGYYLSSWLDFEGLNYISAQLERMTLYTYPIMTTLLGAVLLKEKISKQIIIALALTYSGVMVLYAHEANVNVNSTHTGLGMSLVVLSALIFSFYVVYSKALINRLGSRLFTSIAMLSSTVFVLLHFALTHNISNLHINHAAISYALLLAIFSTVLPSFMMTEAIARIGAARTSIMGTLGPIITIGLAIICLDEPFGLYHLLGIALVMVGISFLSKS
jgi:drug/metabolite transporter (DMT)-like permease